MHYTEKTARAQIEIRWKFQDLVEDLGDDEDTVIEERDEKVGDAIQTKLMMASHALSKLGISFEWQRHDLDDIQVL